MLRFLPLVLKNCWRNRRRTFLTIASISVSMCLLGVMIAMYHDRVPSGSGSVCGRDAPIRDRSGAVLK